MPVFESVIDNHYKDLNPVQFGWESCAPGHSFGPAIRTHWLLHYVWEGGGVFRRAGVTYAVRAGDMFVIPPYEETFYRADERRPWRYTWIGFTGEAALPPALQQAVVRCPGAAQVFEDMQRCADMEGGKSAYLCGKLWELMSLLFESSTPPADYVRKALSIMQADHPGGVTVAGLAESLNLDRSYFSAVFKQAMGVSPQKYLCVLRLERAAELMTRRGESPSTAAASVGYSDIYHFSKAFKKHFGLSPRAYVLRYRQELKQSAP